MVWHKKDDCWYNKKNVKGKCKGVTGRGKNGKDGKCTGQFQGNCSHCGKWGDEKAERRSVSAVLWVPSAALRQLRPWDLRSAKLGWHLLRSERWLRILTV